MGIITLTTDFGWQDGYVAAMKGVILSICKSATLVDVTVPINGGTTFPCYEVTHLRDDDKTIVEYWDSTGVFPYYPIKRVDNKANFDAVETRELHASNVYP